jgi:hypothetical protein
MFTNKNLSSSSKCELSVSQIDAVKNMGNKELINIMNKGNEFAQNGNQQKAAAYHSYVQDSLSKNHGIKFTDSESQKACSNNNSYSVTPSTSCGSTNYYGFYYSN